MKKFLALLLTAACLMSMFSFANADDMKNVDAYNWYEIFVYSYQDSNGDGVGDLVGLYNRLDYIHEMGFNGIWLMPIMPSPSYHKYDVKDYMNVDPAYGTLEDMKKVVDRCHELGIRIIIDMPLNHTSTRHPWFLNAVESLQKRTEDSPYLSYYQFSKEQLPQYVPLNGTKWYYEEQFAGGNMPDLNLENPEVMAEIKKIFAFWLEDVDVDGFRLDAVTSYVASNTNRNISILNQLKWMAEEIKPGSYLVGEAWTGLNNIAAYYESDIDSFFLFPVSQAEGIVVKAMLARSNPAANFKKQMEAVYHAIPDGVLAPFLCNHDTGRAVVALQARQNPARVKFAHGLVNMLGGNTFTYYGDEIGMVGSGEDPNKRLAMYWNDNDMTMQPPGVTKVEYAYPSVEEQMEDEASILNYVKEMNRLKLQYPIIARGENEFVYSDAYVCVMKRTLNGESVYIAVNFSGSKTQQFTLSGETLRICAELEAGEEKASFVSDEQGTAFTLPAYAIVVIN
ncbi:MAG: alpha-amylase [Clostridia bacterium]|nr:alpha-amylase [Clostridia bacterium]